MGAGFMVESSRPVRITADYGNTDSDWGILTIESDDEQFIRLLRGCLTQESQPISKTKCRVPIRPKDQK